MHQGMKVIFNAPPDPRVWYASETLMWCAILFLGPLAVTLLLSPWVYGKLSEDAKSSAVAREDATTFSDPGFRLTLVVFLGAMLLVGLDTVMILIEGDTRGQSVIVNTRAGLPAAAALMSLPAFAAGMAGLFSLVFVVRYRAAVQGTGLLSVIWLLCGGGACLFAAFGALVSDAGTPVMVIWLVLGGVLLLAGLAQWATAAPGGVSISTRVGQAVREEHLEEAQESAKDAPVQGVYMGVPTLVYWGRTAAPAALFGAFGGIAPWFLMGRTGTPMPTDAAFTFALFGFGSGVLVAPIIWLTSARHAFLVKWNEEGVTVTWYRGPARRYPWDALALLRTGYAGRGGRGIQIGERGNYTTVRTTTGENWTIWEGKSGYQQLTEALKAHVWGREGRPAGPGEESGMWRQ